MDDRKLLGAEELEKIAGGNLCPEWMRYCPNCNYPTDYSYIDKNGKKMWYCYARCGHRFEDFPIPENMKSDMQKREW